MKTMMLKPRDLLFFRDGRPMDQDKTDGEYRNVGHGAVWPRPDHLYNAVMHGLLGRDVGECGYGTHGDLRTAGPFPCKAGMLYLPRPLDWDMVVEKCVGTDLPSFLKYGFIDREEGKKDYPPWVSLAEFNCYVGGVCPPIGKSDLYYTEERTGNTLDAATGASKRVAGKRPGLYVAEYLRLAQDVVMWCEIDGGKAAAQLPTEFVMGGQGGIVVEVPAVWEGDDVQQQGHGSHLSLGTLLDAPEVTEETRFVRWTLLTPAYWPETGWLPSWCKDSRKASDAEQCPDGEVMFPDCEGVKLVGACTGKPQYFSGWDTSDGIKPTRLVVPSGSTYLFECPDVEKAKALVARLQLKAMSQLNNQGFGLGVCSTFDNLDDINK